MQYMKMKKNIIFYIQIYKFIQSALRISRPRWELDYNDIMYEY